MTINDQKTDLPYTESPDMAAFTIGRAVITLFKANQPVTNATLVGWLEEVANGNIRNLPAGVNSHMALGALGYLSKTQKAI